MTAELTQLFSLAPDVFGQFFLVFLRVGAALFVLPVFGEAMLPLRVRLAVALAFAFIVYPSVAQSPLADRQDSTMVLLRAFAEVVTGLVMGLILRLHIMAIQIASAIAAQSTSLSQLLGSNSIDPQPALGLVLYMAALALAVTLGLHVQVAMMFIASYSTVPVGVQLPPDISGLIRDAAAAAFRFGFVLATPFVAASLLYNLALGVINRAMPQLMVAFVGAPAITMGAVILLAVTAPLILHLWVSALQLQIGSPFQVPR
ncbi:MAG: flagellar biosynthetic protein FliR [Paracoccaceae bacterium]